MSAKENIKVNENIAVNEPKNTTKFIKDNNNFNERTKHLKSTTRCNKQDTRQYIK